MNTELVNNTVGNSFNLKIELPKDFYLSKDIINYTKELESSSKSCFISGRAGTGKSTFIHYFRNTSKKKIIVLTFTGIASINVKGRTIHSLFAFPPRLIGQKDIKPLPNFMNTVDVIIIDEISMVRADLLDAMDISLRKTRKSDLPFGGVQMVFVGDVFQLSPIMMDKEQHIINQRYPKGPWFFNSHAYRKLDKKPLFFERVYRQEDSTFLQALDRIRENKISEKLLAYFNNRVEGNKVLDKIPKNIMVLAPTNRRTNQLNLKKLNSLSSPEFTFESKVSGIFPDKYMPTERSLKLKVGAQIMTVINGDGYVNGSLGIIKELEENRIIVNIKNRLIKIEQVEWERFDYKKIKEKVYRPHVIGRFRQYPLKLAWASTIHKCQGQTFNRVIIDLDSGTFAHGMTYVALSRVKKIEGLSLVRKLNPNDIKFDERIYKYHQSIQLF